MEPILHFLIPLLLIMALFPRIDKWLILKLSILAVIMDFDLFIPNYHRVAFHNIFFLIIVVFIVYFTVGGLASKIALFFLGSHLIFDLIHWGNAIFWPIYKKLISLNFEIFKFAQQWYFDLNFKLYPIEKMSEIRRCPYLTETGTLILIVVVIAWFAFLYREHKKNRFK